MVSYYETRLKNYRKNGGLYYACINTKFKKQGNKK